MKVLERQCPNVGSNPVRDFNYFMWVSYPATLPNVNGSTQVDARACDNARENASEVLTSNTSVTYYPKVNEPCHDKTNIMGLRPAWIQTSLRIHAVWSESMLFAYQLYYK
jgi:hypothetical protein